MSADLRQVEVAAGYIREAISGNESHRTHILLQTTQTLVATGMPEAQARYAAIAILSKMWELPPSLFV